MRINSAYITRLLSVRARAARASVVSLRAIVCVYEATEVILGACRYLRDADRQGKQTNTAVRSQRHGGIYKQ